MSLTEIISKPLLRGTVVASGRWQAILARANRRVYPFDLGCMVRSLSTGTTVNTHGLGEFAVNDYFIVCSPVDYGDSALFIPDMGKIGRIAAVSASDDVLTIDAALSLDSGDYLLNLGSDRAATPKTNPNFDGSPITLYTDPVGNNTNPNEYLVTGQGGWFQGWILEGYPAMDLLITDESGSPLVALPLYTPGPELIP